MSILLAPRNLPMRPRAMSGSFLLTSEKTRVELSQQMGETARPELLRQSADSPPSAAEGSHSDAGTVVDAKAEYNQTITRLNFYYLMVKHQVLRFQDESLGLYVTDSATGKDGHIRDMIYANAAVWALSVAYKRIDDDAGREHELGHCAVKCMRGILYCWMNQSELLEKFKSSQLPEYALPSRVNVVDGSPVEDVTYPHLQIDVVSLYILYMCQMIESGLKLIFTMEEVHFVQNLVFYLERAYRTPDFGIWERGDKYNTGIPELHASSIGMAKVALESVNGFNLFGEFGASWSVIYVDVDAHNRNRTTLETMLPRESSSKNTDAALIPTLSYPCFAVHKPVVFKHTMDKMQRKLLGKYGFKRYLRDGYGTAIEGKGRRYYAASELKNYESIECEWPLFFVYLIIDGAFHGDSVQVQNFQKLVEPLLRESFEGDVIIPRYYYVPEDLIEAEKLNPGSQERLASGEDPDGEGGIFIWGQALFIVSQLLVEGLIQPNELDPLRRYQPAAQRPLKKSRYSSFSSSIPSDLAVQIALISESMRLQAMLATYGVQTQTPHQIEPIQIWSPHNLAEVHVRLGQEDQLGLTGRPKRPFGSLSTSKIYRVGGGTAICYPLYFEQSDFYLSYDQSVLMDDIRNGIAFVASRWRLHGRPTLLFLIREEMVRGQQAGEMLKLLASLRLGECAGIRVRTGFLQNFLSSSCVEHLDFVVDLPDIKNTSFQEITDSSPNFRSLMDVSRTVNRGQEDERNYVEEFRDRDVHDIIDTLRNTESIRGQSQLLSLLYKRYGENFVVDSVNNTTVTQRMEALIKLGATMSQWSTVRFCSGLLQKMVASLAPSITSILVRGKQVRIGIIGVEEAVISKPVIPSQVKHLLYSTCPHPVAAVLQQEILLICGTFVEKVPHIFDGMLRVRIGWITRALKLYVSYIQGLNDNNTDELNENNTDERLLYSFPPSEIQSLLLEVLTLPPLTKPDDTLSDPIYKSLTPLQRRQIDGCLNRVPRRFYDSFWNVLHRCVNGIKIADQVIPQNPTLSEMALYELNFALKVDELLDRITHPEYRQMIVELIMVANMILERNPELYFSEVLDTDNFIQSAYERFLKDHLRKENSKQTTPKNVMDSPSSERAGRRISVIAYPGSKDHHHDIRLFYGQPSLVTGTYLAGAVVDLLLHQDVESSVAPSMNYSVAGGDESACCIS